MKFKVHMKDTDVLQDAIQDAVKDELELSGLDEDEQEAVRDIREQKYSEIADKWFEYGEYLTVEIDTEERSIRVLLNGE